MKNNIKSVKEFETASSEYYSVCKPDRWQSEMPVTIKKCGSKTDTKYYVDTPMQYTAIFHGLKNDNFQMKNCDIFLIFAQNIDCGYTLEPPQVGGSKE